MSITREHLEAAIAWAESAAKSPQTIGDAERAYRQDRWEQETDCGTACCMHGAACHAAGVEVDTPNDDDYADLHPHIRAQVLGVMCDVYGTPAEMRQALAGTLAQIDPSAVIEPGARVERGVVVEAGARVGRDAVVGRYAVVGAGARVERGARVGEDAGVGAYARVEAGAWVGPGARVEPGAVITKQD